jgi:EmrB/QacA subfamily drug resistance transporter
MTTPLADTPPTLAHRQVLVVFSGLLLVMLLAALDSTIVSTALPTIVANLGGLEHLAWVVTGYLLAQTVVTPIYGKLGDLYGRKIVLQSAVVLFLAGSALCGMSGSMTQLIVFRAVQGLGGGGLMVTTQAVVGDIVPPRDRGRYQGIFGAAFGAASIAGPLLGGYFTTHLSWRWIFYINLPLGLVALAVLAATLPAHSTRRSHAIDFAGASLLAVVLSALTLLADLGGTSYSWTSPLIVGLIASSVVALVGFVVVERRAAEPILPPRLFRQRAFVVSSAVGLIVGFALFGSVTYLPVFLQVAKGVDPTTSGLQMLPMMGGMLTMSIVSGQVISRTGRYKLFPVAGTAVMSVGLYLLSRLTPTTSTLQASLLMLVVGIGLGSVMQVLVIAVQNAVEYRDLGVATSGATLFRLIGGSLGTAILGAVFTARLTRQLASISGATAAHIHAPSAREMAALPPAVRQMYTAAFTASIDTVFLVATCVCVVGFLLAFFLPERPLRATIAATAAEPGEEAAEAFARPVDDESAEHQLQAGLGTLASRHVQRRHIARMVERAGETMSPVEAWLLVQIEHDPSRAPWQIGRADRVPQERVADALRLLQGRGLLTDRGSGATPRYALTPSGCAVLGRLVTARREYLGELASDWNREGNPDVAKFLAEVVRGVVPAARGPG